MAMFKKTVFLLCAVLGAGLTVFAEEAYTVTTSVYGGDARGSVSGGGEVTAGAAAVSLTAEAAHGYVFYRWRGDVPQELIYNNPLSLPVGSYDVEAHFIKPVYVSNHATAEAPDGSSWASAFPTLKAGIDAAKEGIVDNEDRVVFVSQGFYITTSEISVPTNTAIFCSFPGASQSETIKDRSLDLYPTYFSGNTNNIVYRHITPKYGELGFLDTNTVVSVFTGDGRMNPPPDYTGDHDIYVFNKHNTNGRFLNLSSGCRQFILDGAYVTARQNFLGANKDHNTYWHCSKVSGNEVLI